MSRLVRFVRKRQLLFCGLFIALFASAASAQFRQFGGGGFGRVPEGRNVPPRYPPPGFEDGAFTICKLQYTEVRREDMGVGWATDYPYAGINLMTRLSELTKAPVSRDNAGNPNYWVVQLTDPELFHCPFLIGSDVGTMGLSEEEAARLREYLLKGGFLWVDDFWGTAAWEQWTREISRVLPPSEYPFEDVRLSDPIFRTMFDVHKVPQITSIRIW